MTAIAWWPETFASSATAAATLKAHTATTGTFPTAMAAAPATSVIMGGAAEHVGGTVLTHSHAESVTVALTPRSDTDIVLEFHAPQPDGTWVTTTLSAEPETPLATENAWPNWATCARELITTLSGHQLLPRQSTGFSITVTSTVPPVLAIGEATAVLSALALALTGVGDPRDEAPLRLKLATLAAKTAGRIFPVPFSTAAFHAGLRQLQPGLGIVNFTDGSVTAIPSPFNEFPTVIVGTTPAVPAVEASARWQRRFDFIHGALAAFNVGSLPQLPDAPARIADWLTATIEVQGSEDLPTPQAARAWFTFLEEDAARTHHVLTALRARRFDDAFRVFSEPSSTVSATGGAFITPVDSAAAVAGVLRAHGAVATRQVCPGLSDATLAVSGTGRFDEIVGAEAPQAMVGVRVRTGERARLVDALAADEGE
ncbi:MAG: hypothetical protein SPI77_02820 [Corynebacterium sp.]|nr:hypothetical protein [Corynebacterium sp.]